MHGRVASDAGLGFHRRQSGARATLLAAVPHGCSLCNLSSHRALEGNVLDGILRRRKSKLNNLPEELIPKDPPFLFHPVVTLEDSSTMGPDS